MNPHGTKAGACTAAGGLPCGGERDLPWTCRRRRPAPPVCCRSDSSQTPILTTGRRLPPGTAISPTHGLTELYTGLTVGHVLGQGAYGTVYHATWHGVEVAIKVGARVPLAPCLALPKQACIAMCMLHAASTWRCMPAAQQGPVRYAGGAAAPIIIQVS